MKQTKTFQAFQISDFKCRAKSKTQKLRKWAFLLLKPHREVNVFSFISFFRFWVSYTTKNLSKIKLSETSEFSILGKGQNRKLGHLGNWYFFLIKPHRSFLFLRYFLVFRSSVWYNTKHWSKMGTALTQTDSIHQQHLKCLVTEVFKITS